MPQQLPKAQSSRSCLARNLRLISLAVLTLFLVGAGTQLYLARSVADRLESSPGDSSLQLLKTDPTGSTTPENLYKIVYRVAPAYLYETTANWSQWEHRYDGRIKTDADAVKFANEMLASLNDPYTRLYSAEETRAMKQGVSGQFSGIGIGLDIRMDQSGEKPLLSPDGEPMPKADADGYPLVDRVFEGGPALAAGLEVDDAIVSADGVDFKNKSLNVVVDTLTNGKTGTTVKLIARREGADRSIEIVRGLIEVPNVTVKQFGDVGYIRLESFEPEDTVDEMRAALKSLFDSDSLVIDLRGNPGGVVGNSIDLAGLFLGEGTVVSVDSRVPYGGYLTTKYVLTKSNLVEYDESSSTGTRSERHDEPSGLTARTEQREENLSGDRPVVILVNGRTGSASEMFTGALKDNGRAVVVGEQTFGKGVAIAFIDFPNDTMLSVTMQRYFTPKGAWLGDGNSNKHGIVPDLEVRQTARLLQPGSANDNQLRYALDLLAGE